jgi:hypothetical protein
MVFQAKPLVISSLFDCLSVNHYLHRWFIIGYNLIKESPTLPQLYLATIPLPWKTKWLFKISKGKPPVGNPSTHTLFIMNLQVWRMEVFEGCLSALYFLVRLSGVRIEFFWWVVSSAFVLFGLFGCFPILSWPFSWDAVRNFCFRVTFSLQILGLPCWIVLHPSVYRKQTESPYSSTNSLTAL